LFTSFVLVCILGAKKHGECEVYISDRYSSSYEECIEILNEAMKTNSFDIHIDEETSFVVTDYGCVDWFSIEKT
jgi:hypothetical protein